MTTLMYRISLALLIGLSAAVQAQSPVDIGLYRNGNMVDVTVRPQTSCSGIFSAVVFTIRWDASEGAALGRPTQQGPAAQYIPISVSGPVRESGGMQYQVFAGFGMNPMGEAGWVAGQEYVIASIPVTGKSDFELVNDSWTREVANNANFYLSIGGMDRTGAIYKGLAEVDESAGVTILPNPNDGLFTFSFTVTEAANIAVELLNTLGQSVFQDAVMNFSGTYRRDMDISAMSSGVYYLKVTRGKETSVHKMVYR